MKVYETYIYYENEISKDEGTYLFTYEDRLYCVKNNDVTTIENGEHVHISEAEKKEINEIIMFNIV